MTWVAHTWPFGPTPEDPVRLPVQTAMTFHPDEEEAENAARDRCPRPFDLWVVFEIADEPVLPGWSRREERAA